MLKKIAKFQKVVHNNLYKYVIVLYKTYSSFIELLQLFLIEVK